MARLLKSALRILFCLLLSFVVALPFISPLVDGMGNRALQRPPYAASERARALHAGLTVADLHADTMLWRRDLLARNRRGVLDLPRAREGNLAIQAFTVVTKAPAGQNIDRTADRGDLIPWLALVNLWPPRTWFSPLERALYQAEKLRHFAERSHGKLVVLHTSADLEAFLQARKKDPHLVAGFLGLEGGHALEGNLDNVGRLYDAGFRMMAPTHFFDNDLAGAASGLEKGGLTPLGREFIRLVQQRHILIDLAHASERTIDDVTAMSTVPVVVSHSGVRGTCNNQRNLADKQLREVAATGGLIGIGFWETASCGTDAHAIARAARYTANLVGVQHVALGSDFDGDVPEPFDATGYVLITDALLQEGFTRDEVAQIMGGNVVRLLRQALPR